MKRNKGNCYYQCIIKDGLGRRGICCVNLDHDGEACEYEGKEEECGYYEPWTTESIE